MIKIFLSELWYHLPTAFLGIILLAALVWVIVRFWHFKPSFLLAFSGIWLAGNYVFFYVSHSNWWDNEGICYGFRELFANEISGAFIFLFAMLMALLALVRASFGDRPAARESKPADPPVLAEKEGTDEKN